MNEEDDTLLDRYHVTANYGGLGDWIVEHTCTAKDRYDAIDQCAAAHGITKTPWHFTVHGLGMSKEAAILAKYSMKSDAAFEVMHIMGAEGIHTLSDSIEYGIRGKPYSLKHVMKSDGHRYVDPDEFRRHLINLAAIKS